MFAITPTRIKKALKNPIGALRYVLGYLRGKWLKIKLKSRFFSFKKKKISFLKTKSGSFFIDNEGFLREILDQEFIISVAERILNNEFGFLGIKPKIIQNIDWFEDIQSKHLWPKEFYLDLKEKLINDYNKGWDIKNVWELSRFHYLIPLALAFYKTNQEKYLIKWQELVSDWIKKNPIYYGPNWINPMEVAIRACNWIFSYKIIEKKLKDLGFKLDEDFLNLFINSLFEHGCFIFNNLEYAPVHSNHYLSDLVGLIYLGIFFKNLKEGEKWLNFATRELQKEILNQVYEDGVDYEVSISYHRYKTELILWSIWLLKLNGLSIKKECLERVLKMIEFCKAYIKPNGLSPQIGDADDSRLHLIWENYYEWEKRDHSAIFKLKAYAFENGAYEKEAKEDKALFKFEKGGFFIVKQKDFYFIVGRNAGYKGKPGSHQHNDILSFELNINRDDIIIDPGTFVYSPDLVLRNKFRDTRAHNVCLINNEEQNYLSKDIFYYLDKNKMELKEILEDEKMVLIKARFKNLERTFVIDKINQGLLIKDKILIANADLEWNFHLDPLIKIWPKKENNEAKKEVILIGKNGKYLFIAPKVLSFAIIDDEVSFSYGAKLSSKTIQLKERIFEKPNEEFLFEIKPTNI